jgi:hypothetical protein
MIAGVEELRMLREYRTPIMMRYAVRTDVCSALCKDMGVGGIGSTL